MRLRNVKNKEQILNTSSYFIVNPYLYKGNWHKLLKNTNPLFIEIGMGKGKFIIENALKHPEINFIGIEKYDSVIAKALPKIPANLPNLFIIKTSLCVISPFFNKNLKLS